MMMMMTWIQSQIIFGYKVQEQGRMTRFLLSMRGPNQQYMAAPCNHVSNAFSNTCHSKWHWQTVVEEIRDCHLWKCQSVSNIICPLEKSSQLTSELQDWNRDCCYICILSRKSLTQCYHLQPKNNDEEGKNYIKKQKNRIQHLHRVQYQC